MPLPSTVWISTPNKIDHLTSGYTSKVIFNFQYTTAVEVSDTNEVFKVIISNFGDNFKGSNILPQGYFKKIDDGRCFRITMYFYKRLDGEKVNLLQILTDIDDDVPYEVAATQIETATINDGGTFTLCKYEVYINEYREASGAIVEGVGSIFYANSTDGSDLRMTPLLGAPTIANEANAFALGIVNFCKGPIYVVNLMVEEIS